MSALTEERASALSETVLSITGSVQLAEEAKRTFLKGSEGGENLFAKVFRAHWQVSMIEAYAIVSTWMLKSIHLAAKSNDKVFKSLVNDYDVAYANAMVETMREL